jgi:hypothetical protein
LDISKVFDAVNWPYLLQVMTHLGFGLKLRDWISSLWATASSSVLLNGQSGKKILHYRGVKQGDPLSPMLFLLAIEPLHLLFKKAHRLNLLHKLRPNYDTRRVSLYADDATLFIQPNQQELQVCNTPCH